MDNLKDPLRDQKNQQFIGYAKGRGLGWWSWVPSFWLVADVSGQMTAEQLTVAVHDIFQAPCIVIEVEKEGQWSGRGPNQMFQWLRDSWEVLRTHEQSKLPSMFNPHPQGGAAGETAAPDPFANIFRGKTGGV